MKEKKRINPREYRARQYYFDPTSNTFLHKEKSLMKAGFSPSHAKHYPKKIDDFDNYTDILPLNIENPSQIIQNCLQLLHDHTKKLLEVPDASQISARKLAEVRKLAEFIRDYTKPPDTAPKRKEIIHVNIPASVVEAEYKRKGGKLEQK